MAKRGEHYQLQSHDSYFSIRFNAMASPCEFLVESWDTHLVEKIAELGVEEALRIEKKFSRYIKGNLCYRINHAEGKTVEIDNECFRLLEYANTCYNMSDGMFDLTSGVLRYAWKFDCSDRIPEQNSIVKVLPLIGWEKVDYSTNSIKMQSGMEIDFGGIGKEYAVSSIANIFRKEAADVSVLINLGGDIQVTQPRKDSAPWFVGIENHHSVIPLVAGALATSGDAKRFLLKDGKRYSHILNPKTGWPVADAPSSVTTAAPLCIQAGSLATLSLLQGKNAEQFLKDHDVRYWCTRL